jgi:hypothetical protein
MNDNAEQSAASRGSGGESNVWENQRKATDYEYEWGVDSCCGAVSGQ